MIYYTYVLKSEKDDNLYIGFTNDLKKRIKEHTEGMVKSTRGRRPLRLIYFEACVKKEKAIAREKYFKTGFGRRFLKNRI
ncbi:MAG: GIY-YIG nuclease family protein [bacterium]|nr:GIY-YIG nuclease family protein [bacterium]